MQNTAAASGQKYGKSGSKFKKRGSSDKSGGENTPHYTNFRLAPTINIFSDLVRERAPNMELDGGKMPLRRGQTHDPVHCTYINLMKVPNQGPPIFFGTSIKPFHVLMSFL